MTRNFYKILSHTIISVALCTGFAACGGDDDEPPIKPETPEVPDDSGNDDDNDNRFYESVGRFPSIEEDERPYRLLCNEYGKASQYIS